MLNVKQKAGIIPFYIDGDDAVMLFMKPSNGKYGGKTFQIAKGGIEENENPLEAALREASEELGLREENIKWVSKLGVFFGNHHIYIAEVHDRNDEQFDGVTHETEDTAWLTLDEIMECGRELHLHVIKKAFDNFMKKLSDNS